MDGLRLGYLILSSVLGVVGGSMVYFCLDIEEVLTGATNSHIRLFVADVIKSFDTVDRRILDRVLSSLGLPGWLLSLKLASGLGEPWSRDGSIPQGCPTFSIVWFRFRLLRRYLALWPHGGW